MKMINLGNKVVNTYLIAVGNQYLMVDTGYENGFANFCKRLRKHKIDLQSIAWVFLTHAHDDHAGFLNELLKHTAAQVILHPLAVERLRCGQNSFEGGCSTKTALCFCKAMALAGKGEHRFPPIEKRLEERYLLFGSEAAQRVMNELQIKVIETPGHTPCSISFLLKNGALFCGDAAMNNFPSQKRATIWIEDLCCFYRSWETMLSQTPKQIYPGHGKPFSPNDLNQYSASGQMKRLYTL